MDLIFLFFLLSSSSSASLIPSLSPASLSTTEAQFSSSNPSVTANDAAADQSLISSASSSSSFRRRPIPHLLSLFFLLLSPPSFLRRWSLPWSQLISRAFIRKMPFVSTLVTSRLILVHSLLYKLRRSSIICGDRNRQFPAIKDLSVHRTRRFSSVFKRNVEHKRNATGAASVAIFENSDSSDLAEGGEESVDVEIGEGEIGLG